MDSILASEAGKSPSPAGPTASAGKRTAIWVIIVLVVFAGALGYLIYAQRATQQAIAAQADPLSEARKKVSRLEARIVSLEDENAKFKGQADVYAEKLGLTQQELARADALGKKYRKEQEEALASLSGDLGAVREQVAAHDKSLEETRAQLQRAIGDLGEQSGLIARNHDELQELKKRGERDYFDFDLNRSNEYSRIGPVAIRLRKTDTKRQKFTMTLMADDKEIEKKDKTLLEPVQFYMKGKRTVNEIVVYEVDKNRVIGYLSVPKDTN